MNTEATPTDPHGPSFVLVHGVGIPPSVFDRLVPHLQKRRVGAPLRLGYRAGTAPAGIERNVADLLEIAAAAAPTIVVGVSGGATLALALALALGRGGGDPVGIVHVVAHEPLLGPLAPELHNAVSARASALANDMSAEGTAEFVRGLIGPDTWASLPDEARRFAHDHADTVRAEVPSFVHFEPTLADLRTIGVPMTVTVGEHSPAQRHEATNLLARLAAARHAIVAGAQHLACWEQPQAFARVLLDLPLTSPNFLP